MSEGSEANKFLNFPAPSVFSRNREAAQTAGRLFFWLLFFGEAKKSDEPPGSPRQITLSKKL
jgi:hypothetical protein